MRAIVWQGPERMAVEERPDPHDPDPGELIVRPQAVGICGSEVEGYLGHMGNRTPPLVMGHEFAGMVVAAGDGRRRAGRARASRSTRSAAAGDCRLCRAGHANLCPDRKLIGVHSDGAFADLVRAPAASARALPDGVSARTGALVEPLANGVHAVRLGLARGPVERAVVLGAGAIGLVTLQAALLAGIEHVALLEPQAERRERAAALGAHATYGRTARRSSRARRDRRARQRPRARRRRRAGDAAARARAAAAGRAGGLRRPRRRRHDGRLPRRRARPARAAGLLRLHDGRLRAGARVARQRPRLARRARPVRPLDDGPDAFARARRRPAARRRSRSSSPARAGRREHGRARRPRRAGRRRLQRDRPRHGAGVRRRRARSVHAAARRAERSRRRRATASWRTRSTSATATRSRSSPREIGALHALVVAAGVNIKRRRFEETLGRGLGRADRDQPHRRVQHDARVPARAARDARRRRPDRQRLRQLSPTAPAPPIRPPRPACTRSRAAPRSTSRHGVRFTTIAPGVVDTPILENRPQVPDAEMRAQMLMPEDVAAACLFAVSLPPRAYVPELTILPTALQALGAHQLADSPRFSRARGGEAGCMVDASVLVVGGGAIGGITAAKLAGDIRRVVVLDTNEAHVARLREPGPHLRGGRRRAHRRARGGRLGGRARRRVRLRADRGQVAVSPRRPGAAGRDREGRFVRLARQRPDPGPDGGAGRRRPAAVVHRRMGRHEPRARARRARHDRADGGRRARRRRARAHAAARALPGGGRRRPPDEQHARPDLVQAARQLVVHGALRGLGPALRRASRSTPTGAPPSTRSGPRDSRSPRPRAWSSTRSSTSSRASSPSATTRRSRG